LWVFFIEFGCSTWWQIYYGRMDIELQWMHNVDADPDPNVAPHQSDLEFATRPTDSLLFNCDSPSLCYEPNMTPGWASMAPFEPPKTLPEFDFFRPYPTFIFDLDAFPDPAFQKKWCGSESATQLDYLIIDTLKRQRTMSFDKHVWVLHWKMACSMLPALLQRCEYSISAKF
jgi:hypothetical protein